MRIHAIFFMLAFAGAAGADELEPAVKKLSDEQLRARTAEFKEQLQQAVAGVTDMDERKRREREALDE